MQVGIQGRYRFAPAQLVDPWIALGFGYDWMSYRGEGSAWGEPLGYRGRARGIELVEGQFGVDFHAWRMLALGPYLGISHVDYRHGVDVNGARPSDTVDWISLGARVSSRF